MLSVGPEVESAPNVDESLGSAGSEGVARTEEVVVEVQFLPLQPRRLELVVEPELVDGIGDCFRRHSACVDESLPTRKWRLPSATILQLALRSIGTTSSSGAPLSDSEPYFISQFKVK